MPKSVRGVMHEFKNKELHSGGSGKVVTNPKQAIAIALSEQRQLHPHKNLGAFLHPKKGR